MTQRQRELLERIVELARPVVAGEINGYAASHDEGCILMRALETRIQDLDELTEMIEQDYDIPAPLVRNVAEINDDLESYDPVMRREEVNDLREKFQRAVNALCTGVGYVAPFEVL